MKLAVYILCLQTSLIFQCWLPGQETVVSEGDSTLNSSVLTYQTSTEVSSQPVINFYVYLAHLKRTSTRPFRCLYFCSWRKDPEVISSILTNPDHWLGRFARENQLALISWDTTRLLNAGENEIVRSKRLDVLCEHWFETIEKISMEHNLNCRLGLLYGISRGATYAQALAIRKPEFFGGVHTHIGGAFETANPGAYEPLWLVTTGEHDYNRKHSENKFLSLKKAGKFPILKIAEGLKHESRSDINDLGIAFFEYVHDLVERSKKTDRPVSTLHAQILKKSPYTANSQTNRVQMPPPSERDAWTIILPSKTLAEAWPCWTAEHALKQLNNDPAFLQLP